MCDHCFGLTFFFFVFQSRSPKHGPSPQPGAGDQADHISLASVDSLEAMSEGDAPNAFTRGSRVRASLPVVRSTNQTKDRSLGKLTWKHQESFRLSDGFVNVIINVRVVHSKRQASKYRIYP